MVLGEQIMSIGHWWNDADGKDQSARKETYASATLPATNPTWIELSSSSDLGSEKPQPWHGLWTLSTFPCLKYKWQHNVSFTGSVAHLIIKRIHVMSLVRTALHFWVMVLSVHRYRRADSCRGLTDCLPCSALHLSDLILFFCKLFFLLKNWERSCP